MQLPGHSRSRRLPLLQARGCCRQTGSSVVVCHFLFPSDNAACTVPRRTSSLLGLRIVPSTTLLALAPSLLSLSFVWPVLGLVWHVPRILAVRKSLSCTYANIRCILCILSMLASWSTTKKQLLRLYDYDTTKMQRYYDDGDDSEHDAADTTTKTTKPWPRR